MFDVNTAQHTAVALVAIDIAKRNHDVAILWPNGKTATIKIVNSKDGFQRLMDTIHALIVPFKSFSIAQEVKTQTKSPTLIRRRNAPQPVVNFSLKPYFSVHFLRRRFSFSSSFIRFISEESIPLLTAYRKTRTLGYLCPCVLLLR
jgi:hypothetical protein